MLPPINWLAVIVAGLIPSIMGAIFYGPLFEKQWLSSLGKSKEEMIPSNMGLTYGLAIIMAMLLSINMKLTIEMIHRDVINGELAFNSFNTFGHGAFHGLLMCLFIVAPIIVSLSLFQKNSGKNILLNVVFWCITMTLMGGILDSWN